MSTASDTVHSIDGELAHLLMLGIQDEKFSERLQMWENHLASLEITEEMRQVFVAFGWLTPRDRRIKRG